MIWCLISAADENRFPASSRAQDEQSEPVHQERLDYVAESVLATLTEWRGTWTDVLPTEVESDFGCGRVFTAHQNQANKRSEIAKTLDQTLLTKETKKSVLPGLQQFDRERQPRCGQSTGALFMTAIPFPSSLSNPSVHNSFLINRRNRVLVRFDRKVRASSRDFDHSS